VRQPLTDPVTRVIGDVEHPRVPRPARADGDSFAVERVATPGEQV